MVESFNFLNGKVDEVTSIVNEIFTASKEQKQGMIQINDAVNNLDKATQENANVSEIVSNKAISLSQLAVQLVAIVNRTTFKPKGDAVCDVNLVFDTTKLKLDHIEFKEKNFEKVGNGQKWRVKNHHECDLGKWIDIHKNESYANGANWEELLKVHKAVHSGVQEYIEVDGDNKTDKKLLEIAKGIELSTDGVFECIDKIKEQKCKD